MRVNEQGEGTKASIPAVESGQEEDQGWGKTVRIQNRRVGIGHRDGSLRGALKKKSRIRVSLGPLVRV